MITGGLSKQDLQAIVSRKPRKPSVVKEFYIDADGNKHSLAGKKAAITRFEGKTGSVRRSRKGRSYKLPNGSRRFVDSREIEMVAYKLS